MELSLEQRRLLWLSSAEVSAAHVSSLLAEYGSAQTIWNCFQESASSQFTPKCRKILADLHHEEKIDELIRKLESKHVHLLFYEDESYPALLKEITNPPYLLYYAGDLSCLQKPSVAIVGTRTPSDYGRHMASKIADGLSRAGITVVSGLARGIDYAAHRGALNAGGATVGVLGSGINNPYPTEHTPLMRQIARSNGLVLSEYPLDAKPIAFHFPYRNRIISGCSIGVVFVEGRIKSGGMHTVTSALDQGREVFAVPGQTGYLGAEGPLAIMREGARIVTSAEDILEDLALLPITHTLSSPRVDPSLPLVQMRIIQALQIQPLTIDELSEKLKLSTDDIMTETSIMEINGTIRREAGNSFALPDQ